MQKCTDNKDLVPFDASIPPVPAIEQPIHLSHLLPNLSSETILDKRHSTDDSTIARQPYTSSVPSSRSDTINLSDCTLNSVQQFDAAKRDDIYTRLPDEKSTTSCQKLPVITNQWSTLPFGSQPLVGNIHQVDYLRYPKGNIGIRNEERISTRNFSGHHHHFTSGVLQEIFSQCNDNCVMVQEPAIRNNGNNNYNNIEERIYSTNQHDTCNNYNCIEERMYTTNQHNTCNSTIEKISTVSHDDSNSYNNVSDKVNSYSNVSDTFNSYNNVGSNINSYNNVGDTFNSYNDVGDKVDSYNNVSDKVNSYNNVGDNTNSYNNVGDKVNSYNNVGDDMNSYNNVSETFNSYNNVSDSINRYNNVGGKVNSYNNFRRSYNNVSENTNSYNNFGWNREIASSYYPSDVFGNCEIFQTPGLYNENISVHRLPSVEMNLPSQPFLQHPSNSTCPTFNSFDLNYLHGTTEDITDSSNKIFSQGIDASLPHLGQRAVKNISRSAQYAEQQSIANSLKVLTQHLGRTRMNDLTLNNTPKGSGGGYGLGLDFEEENPHMDTKGNDM